jgi:hypothetical protein
MEVKKSNIEHFFLENTPNPIKENFASYSLEPHFDPNKKLTDQQVSELVDTIITFWVGSLEDFDASSYLTRAGKEELIRKIDYDFQRAKAKKNPEINARVQRIKDEINHSAGAPKESNWKDAKAYRYKKILKTIKKQPTK